MIFTKNTKMELAVLLPAYNEEQTVKEVIEQCLQAIKKIPNSYIYVYDNNSTDNTVAEIKTIKSNKVLLKNCSEQGKGAVIRKAFREIHAKCVIMLDADLTYPAQSIPKLYQKLINEDLDMVIGDRLSSSYFKENKRPFHNFGNWLIRKSINTLFKADIKDILTGFRAFSYKFIKSCPVLSNGFTVETEMSIYAIENRMSITNEIIEYKDRPKGSVSKLNTFSDGFKALKTIMRLFRSYHPLTYFSTLAFFITIVFGIISLTRCLIPYFETGYVQNLPTLIVCGLAFIAAIISLFSGLILDSIVQQDKRNFEITLNQWVENEWNHKK
ncbi:MAG: glycosyltransferase family 2 protein [Bifidobacteriaceae bacterium]|jgi:glycosyltransferase involved in cell wall biosynthesis|nr:glycosyltransferase family 2 protein [Bifidobacteriaceae bacterium]